MIVAGVPFVGSAISSTSSYGLTSILKYPSGVSSTVNAASVAVTLPPKLIQKMATPVELLKHIAYAAVSAPVAVHTTSGLPKVDMPEAYACVVVPTVLPPTVYPLAVECSVPAALTSVQVVWSSEKVYAVSNPM